MKTFHLKVASMILCFGLGASASWELLTQELNGGKEYLLTFISLSCLPLAIAMLFDTMTSSQKI